MIAAARLGRVAAQGPEARAKLEETGRKQALARFAWDSSTQPKWLTAELFSEKIQPLLAHITLSTIQSRLGVSVYYASQIRKGQRIPHPRHWISLAELLGISG